VLFTEHHEMIQALGLNRLNPALDVGTDVWRLDRAAVDIEALAPEGVIKRPCKLAVAIVEDDLGLEATGRQRAGKRLGLLLDPGGDRMLGGLGDKDLAAADVQEGDDEELPDASQRQHLVREEVTLPEGGRVHLEELVPGLLAALRTGIEAVLTHDVGDKLIGDFLRRQLADFAPDTRVAPARIRTGQLEDQLADIDASASAGLTRHLARLILAEPAQKGRRRHDGDEVLDRAPQRFTQANQPAPLLGRDHDTFRQTGTQLLVLGLGELKLSDRVLELPSHGRVGQLGQKDDQRVENGPHESILQQSQVVGVVDDMISL
jgi:hypothetical protein